MDKRNQNLDELLSSKLDGKLSTDEAVELAKSMADDPALSRVLGDLQAAKRLLLSGRSKRSLGNDFSASVTASAQKRAAEMGEMAPKWIISNDFQVISRPSLRKRESKRFVRWLSVGGLSLAATLLLVWLTLPSANRDEIALVPTVEETANGDASVVEPLVPVTELPGASLGNPTVSSTPSVRIASNSASLTDVSDDSANGKIKHPLGTASDVASPERKGVPKLEMTVASSEPPKTDPRQKLFYTMVLDVSIDPSAVENRTLERILEKYNIVYTDELVIDDSQVKSLMESKLVGSIDTEEKMGVMFLRSTAKKLDLAMREIINQFEEFPDFALDLTTDPSAQLLVKQLGSIKVAEGSDGLAHRLAIGKSGRNSSPFSASARRGRPMSTDSRTTYKGGIVSTESKDDEMSNVLFLIRPAR